MLRALGISGDVLWSIPVLIFLSNDGTGNPFVLEMCGIVFHSSYLFLVVKGN